MNLRVWSLLAVASLFGASARAADQVDLQAFKPSTYSNGAFVTESGATEAASTIDAALWLHYQHDPLVLRDVDGKITRVIVGNQVSADIVGSYAIFDWLGVGLALPGVLYQDGEGDLSSAKPGLLGLGDIRVMPKIRVLNLDKGMLALSLVPEIVVPTGHFFDKYLGESNFAFVPAVAATTSIGTLLDVSANLAYTDRFNTTLDNFSIRDELTGRIAASLYVWPEHLTVIGEAYGATQAWRPFDDAGQFRAEMLLGARYALPANLSLTAGVGTNPSHGIGTPDFRVFAALGWTLKPAPKAPPAPLDTDHDGINDNVDKCPTQPEDKDGFQDEDGCPDPDNDNDGIPDNVDKCPNEPETVNGFEDTDGCPDVLKDTDGDGITDNLDKCPTQPEDKDGFQDEDGCPDPDNDNDGLADTADKCPNEAGPIENYGCPDKDRDGDGVVDRIDNCPDEPGPPENHGCKVKQLVIIKKDRLEILDKVFFDTDKTIIQKRSFGLLDNVASVMKSHPEIVKISVEGHTDTVGKPEHNQKLSQGRAESVKAYLVNAGVEAARLDAVGYGQDRPIAPNIDEKGRSQNRRVEFRITDPAPAADAPKP